MFQGLKNFVAEAVGGFFMGFVVFYARMGYVLAMGRAVEVFATFFYIGGLQERFKIPGLKAGRKSFRY